MKERTLTLNLSDEACKAIAKKAGASGLTVAELLENFIGDLTGEHTNGSDESDLADQWFERCWFGMFPENTLLHHLLTWEHEPEEYLDILHNIETAEEDKKKAAEHPEDYDEEDLSYIDDDIASWEERLKDMRAYWIPEEEPNMEDEIERLKKWIKEVAKLKGE